MTIHSGGMMSPSIMTRLRVTLTLCGAFAMVAAGASLAGCGGGQEGSADGADTAAHAHTHTHPEGDADHDAAGHHHDDAPAGVQARLTRIEFASQPAGIVAGTPATWTITVLDAATGKPMADFDTMHEKLMHLIVVSSDLTWFNHLHPRYEGEGRFTLNASLPREGHYKLYADYTPMGKTQEVAQYELATAGAGPTAAASALVPDTIGTGGWMLRNVTSAPEGEPEAKGGSAYQVALMPMPSTIVAGKDVMLHFEVRDAAGKPVGNLQPYLGAMGHAVLLSSDTKIYLHTHPMDGAEHEGMDHGAMGHAPMTGGGAGAVGSAAAGAMEDGESGKKSAGGSEVMFHTNFPTPGLYKVWGQFRHNGKIITAPFVLKVG